MSRAARTRNPRGEGTRLREEILDAAVALIDETGDRASLTLRGIARRAGISAPSIYTHFADLPAILDAVLALSFEHLRTELADAVAAQPDDDPAGALIAAGLAYVEFGWQHRARYQLMFEADGYAANAIETFTIVERLVGACAEAGVGHSADSQLDTWLLWAALHGVATLEKPSRTEHRRLGILERPALLSTMIRRLARIDDPPR